MKIATTKDEVLEFNGHCKSKRIKGALALLEGETATKTLLSVRGLFPDGANIRRYANAIKTSKDKKVFVTKRGETNVEG